MNKGSCGIDNKTVPTSMETIRPNLLSHLNLGIYDKQMISRKNSSYPEKLNYILKKLADYSDLGLIGKR